MLTVQIALANPPGDSTRPTVSATEISATQPAAPEWFSREPDKWPQILLRNQVTIKNMLPWQGTCGFLMKLPQGQTVAVAAFHQLVQGIRLDDLKDSVSAWQMFPPNHPAERVTLRVPALPADQADAMNCVMMTVAPEIEYPAFVLTASPTPAQVGQTVYLVGMLDGDKTNKQSVYKGIVRVLNHPTPGLIAYEFHANVPHNSFSGSPVLDELGRVIAVHQSYYPEVTSGEDIVGCAFQIDTVIATVNLPAPAVPKLIALHPSTEPSDPNVKSQQALRTARAYIAAGMVDKAREKLRDLIQKYPGTPAARDAQADLDRLAGQ